MKGKMYAYLISHDKKDIKTHTYIGCTSDFKKRLAQHNGHLNGGPRMTKRAAGHWKPVVVLELAPDRNFDSKDFKKQWKSSSRGLESRIRKAFELALLYKLKIYISEKHNNEVFRSLNDKWKNKKIKLSMEEYMKLFKSS